MTMPVPIDNMILDKDDRIVLSGLLLGWKYYYLSLYDVSDAGLLCADISDV